MSKTLVAEWKTRGKAFYKLYEYPDGCFTYDGYQCGGCMGVIVYQEAIDKIKERISWSSYKSWRRIK